MNGQVDKDRQMDRQIEREIDNCGQLLRYLGEQIIELKGGYMS